VEQRHELTGEIPRVNLVVNSNLCLEQPALSVADWGRWYVCWLHRGSICLSSRPTLLQLRLNSLKILREDVGQNELESSHYVEPKKISVRL